MENEVWMPIIGYEGLYEVSSVGRVKSLKREVRNIGRKPYVIEEKLLKMPKNSRGYNHVRLCKDGISKTKNIHTIVALVFLSHTTCLHNKVIDHINNIKSDNRISNLQVITNRLNTSKDKIRMGLSTGVSFCEKKAERKFRSIVLIGKKRVHLGFFESNELAHEIYLKAIKFSSNFTGDTKEFRQLIK